MSPPSAPEPSSLSSPPSSPPSRADASIPAKRSRLPAAGAGRAAPPAATRSCTRRASARAAP
eukprot:20089-Pyramimonas_sp.AAC.1